MVATGTRSTIWHSGRGLKGQSKTQECTEEFTLGVATTKAKLKLNSTCKKQMRTERYEESKLRIPENRQQFRPSLRNRFSILQTPDQNDTYADRQNSAEQPDPTNNIKQRQQKIKSTCTETALTVPRHRKKE